MSFRMFQVKVLVVLVFTFLTVEEVLAQQGPGSLDTTFGVEGIVSRFIGGPSIGRAVALQPDGKIVEAGWFATRFGLIRYNENGSLDQAFGVGGVVTTNINNWAFVESIAIQSDGRIVAAGWSYEGRQVAAVARYNSNGALDTSFGGDGTITTVSPLTAPSANLFQFYALDMAVQPDGKTVIVGESYYCAIGDDFCDFGPVEDYLTAVRYNVDGTVDSTFGNNGFVVETDGSYYSPKVAIRNNGKIIVTGGTSILQYRSDGSRDTTFGVSGVASTPNTASDIAIQPDGKVVISIYAYAEGGQAFGVVRFRENGTLDATFGSGGEVVTAGGGEYGSVSHSLAIQADGRIVVAGTGFDPGVDWRYVVRRYNPDGTLDHSYGTEGITRVQVGGLHNEAFAVAVDANGRAVVGGCAFSDSGWGLIRLNGGGVLSPRRSPFDFDGDGRSDISVFRPSDSVWYINRSSDGFSATQFGVPADDIAPADYDGDDKTDIAVFRDGVWWRIDSTTNTANAAEFGQAGDIPVPSDYTGDGRAELAFYRGGEWWTHDLSNGQTSVVNFGLAGDKPVPADYDGDGKADVGIFRPDGAQWWIQRSTAGSLVLQFGTSTDIPVAGDYTGDGKADVAVFRGDSGEWYIRRSEDASILALPWGSSGDIPAPGDYDGDGKVDAAIFRPGDGKWWIFQSGSASPMVTQFGITGDRPVPSAYVP